MGRLTLFAFLMSASSIRSARVAQEHVSATPPRPSRESAVDRDVVDGGVQLFTDSLEVYQDPSVRTAGATLVSAAGLAALIPVAPANYIVAACLGTVGVLMQHYDSTTTAPSLSNTQVATRMSSGFQDVTRRLSAMNVRLDTVVNGQEQLMRGIARVTDLLRQLLDGLAEKINVVGAGYKTYMTYMDTAAQEVLDDPERSPHAYSEGVRFLDSWVLNNRALVNNHFEPSRIRGQWMAPNNCSQRANLYQSIVSSRVQLSTMIVHWDSYSYQQREAREGREETGLGRTGEGTLTDLMEDLVEYHQSALEHHVPISSAEIADCERSLISRNWSQFPQGAQVLPRLTTYDDWMGRLGRHSINADDQYVYVLNGGKVWQQIATSGGTTQLLGGPPRGGPPRAQQACGPHTTYQQQRIAAGSCAWMSLRTRNLFERMNEHSNTQAKKGKKGGRKKNVFANNGNRASL